VIQLNDTNKHMHVMQGGFCVSADPDTMMTTILGSCVAVCLRDPVAQVGGMNHFLLAKAKNPHDSAGSAIYGVHLMEVLVNGLLNLGASRNRLEAKVFGGATIVQGLGNIGAHNVDFAINFLKYEGIKYKGGNHGGSYGRRVQYWPVSGRARQRVVDDGETVPVSIHRIKPVETSSGELELF